MAINFLNTVDLNQNQLNQAAIQNLAANPASGVEGQIYFNTVAQTIRVYKEILPATTPKTYEWASISGDLTGLTAGTYINIDNATGPVPTINHDTTSRTDTPSTSSPGYGGDIVAIKEILTNSTGHVTTVKTETYTLPADTNETYTLPTTTGIVAPNAPTTGIISLTAGGTGSGVKSTVTFTGTTNRIDVAGSTIGTNGAITIDLTDSITVVDNIILGGVITQSGGVSTTGVNSSALSASTTLILTANNTAVIVGMQISGTGIPDNITVVTVTDAKTFVLSGAITIANGITITFEEVNSFSSPLDMNNNRIHEVKTGVLGTDGVNLAQVQDLVAGIGLFKGGYNATTGLTVNLGAGNGSLDGGSNIALDTGDFFVVTVAGGAFYSTTLEVGDMIFANQTIAANSTPAIGVYTVVIQDANIAGSGATDAATEKGVAGFDSAFFDVSASGWVQLDSKKNPYGAKVALNNTSPVSRATSGTPITQTTFTVSVDDASIFGSGALASNVKVEVLNNVSPLDTVYPCVERSGSGTLAIKFSGDVAINLYQVLLSHI
jgi:hypothetical protein